MASRMEKTYWNGEETPCRKVQVLVGTTSLSWWSNGLEGTVRDAVEVRYGSDVFYLDDDDGEGVPVRTPEQEAKIRSLRAAIAEIHEKQEAAGQRRMGVVDGVSSDDQPAGRGEAWWKVTVGRGMPAYRHRDLPSDSSIVGGRT